MTRHALLIGIDEYPNFEDRHQLEGCIHDVEVIADILEKSYQFKDPEVRLNEEATREGILTAMDDLVRRVEDDDVVTFFYSGHGSQRLDLDGDEPDGLDETIVPYDSGRIGAVNRDISDDEIHQRLLCLTEKTSFVTVIFDCCHSGTILRAASAKVRQVPPDRRVRQDRPSSPRPTDANKSERKTRRPMGRSYTLISACRDKEVAFELPAERHGALTFFLSQELRGAKPGDTFRDVMERVRPRLVKKFTRQHPQLSGVRDRELFGIRELRPMSFFPVSAPIGAEVKVGAGKAFGMTVGTVLDVYPPATRSLDGATPSLGRLELVQVDAHESTAKILEQRKPQSVTGRCRAVVSEWGDEEMKLVVRLADSTRQLGEGQELASRIESSPLLRLSGPEEQGDVYICRLDPSADIEEPRWAALGQDGEAVLPLLPCRGDGALSRLCSNLERRARYVNVLRIENNVHANLLLRRARLELKKQRGDSSWAGVEAEMGDQLLCQAGDRFGIEVHNDFDREIYVHVLNLGLTGQISLLYPVEGVNEPLLPRRSLKIGMSEGDAWLEIRVPEDFPFDKAIRPDGSRWIGVDFIKIFVTLAEADFSVLQEESYHDAFTNRSAKTGWARLLRQALTGETLRRVRYHSGAKGEDLWLTLTRSFLVEGELTS